jgi:hypothetical protein
MEVYSIFLCYSVFLLINYFFSKKYFTFIFLRFRFIFSTILYKVLPEGAKLQARYAMT